MVLSGFGRMIDAGDDEAPALRPAKGHFTLEIFNAPSGPIVGVFEGQDTVHVIRPCLAVANGLRNGGLL